MNAKVKRRWIKALRGGKYQQGKHALRTNGKFCCLGVLCDLHATETGGTWEPLSHTSQRVYLGEENVLPGEVVEWAGLTEDELTDPGNPKLGNHRNSAGAVSINDRGETFEYIANRIEKYL